jgi:hypothetical protein
MPSAPIALPISGSVPARRNQNRKMIAVRFKRRLNPHVAPLFGPDSAGPFVPIVSCARLSWKGKSKSSIEKTNQVFIKECDDYGVNNDQLASEVAPPDVPANP